ncbi:MAG: hypothetical protein ACKVTZ_06065 [Bacteroidia bacterium]
MITNHKRYSNFNTLGLYRGIVESEKLSVEEKIQVRDFANKIFGKTYDFLQIKDGHTYYHLHTLGKEMTKADEEQVWEGMKAYKDQFLKRKHIKHHNFGNRAKHSCGYEDCYMNGRMLNQKNGGDRRYKDIKKDRTNNIQRTESKKMLRDAMQAI